MNLKKSNLILIICLILLFGVGCSHQSDLADFGDKLGVNLKAVSTPSGSNNQDNTRDDDSPTYLKEDYLSFDGKQGELNIFLECTTGFMEASYLESIYNPFSEYYIATDKRLKQEYHRKIEKKYNISIQYINGGDVCNLFDGPATYERALALGKADNIQAVISSNLLKPGTISSYPNPTSCGFGNAKYYTGNFIDGQYASLYDLDKKEGLFCDVQYTPNQLKLDLSTYFNQVYAYIPQEVYYLDFLYYPTDLEKKYQIHKQYEEGNWNYETINRWMEEDPSGEWNNGFFPYTHVEEYLAGIFAASYLTNADVFDMENEDTLNAYLTYCKYGSYYESNLFRPFQLIVYDQLIGSNIYKYDAIPFPSNSNEEKMFISKAPGYVFPHLAEQSNGFSSEIVFKIIYELEDGYRYQSNITEEEKMRAYLGQYLTEESVEMVISHQENVVFQPYTKLLEAIIVMADDSKYHYLGQILRTMGVQNIQSTQEAKEYLNQLSFTIALIDQDGGCVDFKGTYFEFCRYYFDLIFNSPLDSEHK